MMMSITSIAKLVKFSVHSDAIVLGYEPHSFVAQYNWIGS